MKLSSLTICNYKNYYGKQNFTFQVNEGKNIVLVGGENGAGKTTLLGSILLCLYGHQFSGKPLSKAAYDVYIRSCQNHIALDNGDNSYFIEMDVILDDVQPVYAVTLRRSWKISEKSIHEKFELLRDGKDFEIVEKENWQQYIYDIFPPYTSRYFFFDGEMMKDLVDGDSAEDILKESARDLIGLKIYNTLLGDIEILKEKILKSTKKDEKNQKEYDTLTAEVNELNKQDSALARRIEEIEATSSQYQERIDELRDDIFRKAGAFAQSLDKYDSDIARIKQKLIEQNTEISNCCDYAPFIMAFPIMLKAYKQLDDERNFREGANDRNIVEKVREKLKVEFKGNLTTLKAINKVLDGFEQSLDDRQISLILHDVNNATYNHFVEYLNTIKKDRKKHFLSVLKEREQLDLKLQRLQNARKKMPDQVYVQDELDEIAWLENKITDAKKMVADLNLERGSLQQDCDTKSKRLQEIDTVSLDSATDQKKFEVCGLIESVLNHYINYTLANKVKTLESIITEMYLLLENKEDLVERLSINPETFGITLYGYDGREINKRELSSGEKEILALSIIWGLSKLSRHHLPIVVDSLIARLDKSHVHKVATRFLPKAGDQVIILSHSREVNKPMYEVIKPYLSDEYLLSYDAYNKIAKGYFEECL